MAYRILGSHGRAARLAAAASLSVGSLLAQPLGAQERKLNAALPPTGAVLRYSITADGAHALYVADANVDGQFELFAVGLDPRATPVQLNAALPGGGDVLFELSSHERAVFGAPRASDGKVQLYSAPIEGGGTPLVLSSATIAGNVAAAAITLDETRAVYLADQEVQGRTELYAVPIDGSGSPLKLNHVLTGTWEVTDFALSTDGSSLVYLAARTVMAQTQTRVYAGPLDASSAPLQLAEHTAVMDDPAVVFSADGQWITYEVDLGGLWSDLYLVPVDASQATVQLNDEDTFEWPASGAAFTAAGDRVAFRTHFTDGFSIQFSYLYSAELDGSVTPLAVDTDVRGFQHASGGSLFFAASTGVFSMPVDGSAARTQLASGASTQLSLTADECLLAYVTSAGLQSLPSSGGTPTVLFVPQPGKSVASAVISPDSRHVVYRTGSGSSFDLYSVEIDGSSAAERLHGALPAGRAVGSQRLAGGRVVFGGDLDTDNVQEVFSAFLGAFEGAPRSAPAPTRTLVR